MSAGRLVVATYNIRRCIGTDGRHDPERIAEVILGLEADLVALQEVDCAVQAPGRIDQLRFLAGATGMEPVAGPALRRAYGEYGNGLLSRLPIRRVRRHDLSVTGCEPRAALEVELDGASGRLRMVTTHLGLRSGERRQQVARLMAIIGGSSASRPLILAGDFNYPLRWSGPSRALRRAFGAGSTPRTFPARRPLFALDRLLVRPAHRLRSLRAVRTPATRVASDHLPLRAELTPGDPPPAPRAVNFEGPVPR